MQSLKKKKMQSLKMKPARDPASSNSEGSKQNGKRKIVLAGITTPAGSNKRSLGCSPFQPRRHAQFPVAITGPSLSRQGINGRSPKYVGHFHDYSFGITFIKAFIQEPDKVRLRIPDAFVKEFGRTRQLIGQVKLLLGGACSFNVHASKVDSAIFLTDGWHSLAESVPLEFGYMLTFRVVDTMVWSLTVYNGLGLQVRFDCHEG
ncbi:hypothetical protein ACQ4PT_054129 [Festuca glaucescens]